MNKQIEIIRNTRKYLLGFIEELTVEELNKMPDGFNNNVIWNIGHLIATQQNACYNRSGLPLTVEEKYLLYYPDTKPTATLDKAEVDAMKQVFLTVIDRLEADYNNNSFSNYTPWTNRYGVMISTIDEMLGFLPYHEGLHLGYVMAQKRTLLYQKNLPNH